MVFQLGTSDYLDALTIYQPREDREKPSQDTYTQQTGGMHEHKVANRPETKTTGYPELRMGCQSVKVHYRK